MEAGKYYYLPQNKNKPNTIWVLLKTENREVWVDGIRAKKVCLMYLTEFGVWSRKSQDDTDPDKYIKENLIEMTETEFNEEVRKYMASVRRNL